MPQLVQSAQETERMAGCSPPWKLDKDMLVMPQLVQSALESERMAGFFLQRKFVVDV